MPHTLSRRTFLANAAAVPAVAFVPAGIATGKTYAVLTESLIGTERDAIHSAMKGSDIGAAAVCLVEGGQVRWRASGTHRATVVQQ